jgi:single-stranded DNA-binding protein
MNTVNLFGCLDSEPELLGMPGRDICEFWLTVPGRLKKHTAYVKVVAFRGLAERLARQLSKGDRVVISGHLRSEPWPGSRRLYRHTVVAREVQLATELGSDGIEASE